MKRCRKCDQDKPADAFGTDRSRKDGKMVYCRECVSARTKAVWIRDRDKVHARNVAWKQSNRERTNELARKYYRQSPEVMRYRRFMWRAHQAGVVVVPFTVEQMVARWNYYGGKCWMCGCVATDMDHVKPMSKGGAHTLCNMRPACGSCNSIKGTQWPVPAELLVREVVSQLVS